MIDNCPIIAENMRAHIADADNCTLGSFLKDARLYHGWSRREAAELLDITQTWLWMLEHERYAPKLELLIGFAKVYEIPMQTLIKLASNKLKADRKRLDPQKARDRRLAECAVELKKIEAGMGQRKGL